MREQQILGTYACSRRFLGHWAGVPKPPTQRSDQSLPDRHVRFCTLISKLRRSLQPKQRRPDWQSVDLLASKVDFATERPLSGKDLIIGITISDDCSCGPSHTVTFD